VTLAVATHQLLAAYQNGTEVALLFDYDGTLTPIVPHPWLAEMSAETRQLLQDLIQQPRLHLGILSGRSLEELIQMVGLGDIYYGGTSGLELDLRGKRLLPPRVDDATLMIDGLARSLQSLAAGAGGAWVEKKPLGLTVHYRAVAPALIPALRERVNHILGGYAGQVEAVPGPSAIEITASLGWNKGTAVYMIVNDMGTNVLPFYAGDFANDAVAMEAVRNLGGIAVGVGAQAPAASCSLSDTSELLAFLQSFLEKIEQLAANVPQPAVAPSA
jgi:trehalose 6-phosphate phosphatase